MSKKKATTNKAHFIKGIGELLTLEGAFRKNGRKVNEADLSIKKKQALLVSKGRIVWSGTEKSFSKAKAKQLGVSVSKETNLAGKTVMPGFVESHTHTVFAGERQNEFEMLNSGMSYQEIAKKGGGIQSTVTATQKTSEAKLLELAQTRVDQFITQGVTTLETKSGYGLNHALEVKLLKVARKLKKIPVVSTYLGAHSKPKDISLDLYMNEICEKTLPYIAKNKLADRVDIFIEKGFYTTKQAEWLFQVAKKLGLPIAAHVEQLSHSKGTQLAIKHEAQSVDHLVHIDKKDIAALVNSKTVASLLPSSDFYLNIPYPPARKLIDSGAQVALATDFNPGSSPSLDLSMVGVLARLQMKMSLPEVLVAYTFNAAAALGKSSETGSISLNKAADFAVLSSDWDQLFYRVGDHPVDQTWSRGRRIFKK